MEAIEAATHAQAPAGNVYGLGAETPSRRRVTDDVFDMGVVRGRARNSLSSLNLSFDIYPSPIPLEIAKRPSFIYGGSAIQLELDQNGRR